MAINTYGIKMNGLKKASGYTENYGPYSGSYVELFYDKSNGDVWGIFQHSLGQNSWTVYHDPDVIKVCNTSSHMTMQQIADCIRDRLQEASRA